MNEIVIYEVNEKSNVQKMHIANGQVVLKLECLEDFGDVWKYL